MPKTAPDEEDPMSHRFALTVAALGLLAAPALAGAKDVQVIVKFKGDADAAKVTAAGGEIVKTIDALDAVVARIPAGKVAALKADASVSYVEEDGICEALGKGGGSKRPGGGDGDTGTTTPPAQDLPWGVETVLPTGATETGDGVKVAVVDTGIDLDHPDLADNVASLKAVFVSFGRTTNGDDDNGHGSHVAGTIGAIDNSIGVVGVAPGVTLHAVKVLDKRGSGTWGDVADGIRWCRDYGMNIANMSLGGGSSTTVQSACDYAWNGGAGVLLVAAAGNSGDNSTATDEWSYPASYASVVSVGATTSSDTLAYFSNTNSAVEVSAPGYQIPSTYKSGGYDTLSGTSMASPHAAGVAALLWGAATSAPDADAIRKALQGAVRDLGPTGDDNGFGLGCVVYED